MAGNEDSTIQIKLTEHELRIKRLEELATQDRERDQLLVGLRVEIATLREQLKGAIDRFGGQFKWLWGLMVAIFLALMGNILLNLP